jgi:hypothetical protein
MVLTMIESHPRLVVLLPRGRSQRGKNWTGCLPRVSVKLFMQERRVSNHRYSFCCFLWTACELRDKLAVKFLFSFSLQLLPHIFKESPDTVVACLTFVWLHSHTRLFLHYWLPSDDFIFRVVPHLSWDKSSCFPWEVLTEGKRRWCQKERMNESQQHQESCIRIF